MRVVVTRPREQADSMAEALRAHGIEPVYFATIQIAPVKNPKRLDATLRRLARFDWVVFTSANAVEAVWERLARMEISFPARTRAAAVGPKTAASLKARGVTSAFVPEEFVAEAIVPGLGDLMGKSVMLPLADLAEDTLAKAIESAGGSVVVVTAYHTLPPDSDPDGLAALQSGVDAVTFTSGSSARNFAMLAGRAGLNPLSLPGSPIIACIGPKTAAAAREMGFRVEVVAEDYTVEGLVEALGRRANKYTGRQVHR